MGRYKRKYIKRKTKKDKLIYIIIFGIISPIVSIILAFFLVNYIVHPNFLSHTDDSTMNTQALEQEHEFSNGEIGMEIINIFNIQTGSFTDLENAKTLVEKLNKKDIPAYIIKSDNYKVFSGTFFKKVDAEEYEQYLNQKIEKTFINENFIEGKVIIDEELIKEDVKKISELIELYNESFINETSVWKEVLISKKHSKIKEIISENNSKISDIHKELQSEYEILVKLNKIFESRKKIPDDIKEDNLLTYYSEYNKILIQYINIIKENEED
ncbi:SPOR domain-containing protein [Clostridium sp. D2Q-14]|uniref:SPOR domain-containing protein n=1 Tax=Anaeromonas gelatinilytica TaxID=2683194 RepID=UPI00193C0264|nr:SPOR domain-containing protein [Anaeromonas gelatinilytica]MBS4535959.1 SPOR domain-containing protein [Anaeromonas gelatinilytica]